MEYSKILEIINKVMDDIPLDHNYDDDGRYAWPNRWNELIKRLKEEASQHGVEAETKCICDFSGEGKCNLPQGMYCPAFDSNRSA